MSGRPHAIEVDVRAILQRSVADLYSHLVTRPTGRAVRLAIENQLQELERPALSLVDLSSVTVLDYSCADEVVAKLLLRYSDAGAGVFFLLVGVQPQHRDPIEEVLERHGLAVVAETATAHFELLGSGVERERDIWTRLEERRRVPEAELEGLAGAEARACVDSLLGKRLAFRDPIAGDVFALSTLVGRPG